jgi:ankyrin repeat protein
MNIGENSMKKVIILLALVSTVVFASSGSLTTKDIKANEQELKKADERGKLDFTDSKIVRKHFEKQKIPMTQEQFVSYVLKEDTASMSMFLVCNKGYLNTPNGKGNTALSTAVNKKKTVIVKYLLDKGADISIKSEQLGLTPLEDAATSEESTENGIFAILIEAQKKKDPNLLNIDAAMHMASRFGALKNVQILVENGANPSTKSLEGLTPLHEAAKEGRKPVVEYLISQKVEINPLDKDGYTPLDWAEAMGVGTTFPEIAKVLQKAGGKHTDAFERAFEGAQ